MSSASAETREIQGPFTWHHLRDGGVTVLSYLLLSIGAFLFIFPFYYMIIASFMEQHELISAVPKWLPKRIMWTNYVTLFDQVPYARNLFNSLFVAVVHTVVVLFFCSLAAFAFAKLRFPGRDRLFVMLLITMMLPRQLTLVPLYLEMLSFNWIDTYWPLIVPDMANAFGIFLMRQYSSSVVSDELLDSARIDGCTTFGMYWRVALPIVIPGLAVLGLLTFVGTWNSFLWPLLVLNRETMFTVPLALVKFAGWAEGQQQLCVMLAGATLATMPLVFVFLFTQKYFMGGIMSGALKG